MREVARLWYRGKDAERYMRQAHKLAYTRLFEGFEAVEELIPRYIILKNLYIKYIKNQAENIVYLIRRAKFLAKEDSVPLRIQIIDLRLYMEEAESSVKAKYADKKINFQYELQAENIEISGDKTLITDVFMVIFDNSVRYSRKDYVDIKIKVTDETTQNSFWRIEISDSGPGMPESIRKTVFFREGSKEGGWSSGLGLTYAYRIIKRFDGDIYVEEGYSGKGTKIVIVLPRYIGAAQ